MKGNKKLPSLFRPLLWSLSWKDIDIEEDKEDIIVNTVNYGNLKHWKWLLKTYGEKTIKQVLQNRLESEFHPESRNLAKVLFSVTRFRHAR